MSQLHFPVRNPTLYMKFHSHQLFSPEKKCRDVLPAPLLPMESQLRARMGRVSFTSWSASEGSTARVFSPLLNLKRLHRAFHTQS